MNINKYIKWGEIWYDEICLQTSIDCLENNDKTIKIIQQFIDDKDVELMTSECYMNENKLIFFLVKQVDKMKVIVKAGVEIMYLL